MTRIIVRGTESFKGGLWVEVARPGRSSQQENALIEAGSRVGARPVAGLAARFALPGGYNTFRLVTAVRQGVPPELQAAQLAVTRENLPGVEVMRRRSSCRARRRRQRRNSS